MKMYTCSNCHNSLYFENNICLSCNNAVGFDSQQLLMLTIKKNKNNIDYSDLKSRNTYKYCENTLQGNCNWLIPANSPETFCVACALNRTIPPLTSPENKDRWDKIEFAKHRLIYSLLRLKLPVKKKIDNSLEGLAFDFMTDISPDEKVMTGHDLGLITLNIDEADEAERAKHKFDLGEKYRTLLGHFRHEIGHYYWDVLIQNSNYIERYRQLFGDETFDYDQALINYYENPPMPNWENNFISIYATAHSWEDWAETWAHYMHMMDTLETAYSFGIKLDSDSFKKASIVDPYTVKEFSKIFNMWV
ncbi:MAG: putative zinc-binding peptidase, partial [Cytophagales bacterium]|nr:putative zinc-binding peptidase [Cytophaga sp.]